MGKEVFVVGLLLRRQFRRILRQFDVEFIEDKGWLDSQFKVTGSYAEIRRLRIFCDKLKIE